MKRTAVFIAVFLWCSLAGCATAQTSIGWSGVKVAVAKDTEVVFTGRKLVLRAKF